MIDLPNGATQSYPWYFFFSSRRRHTRFDCDWSSDVCSSDLGAGRPLRCTSQRPASTAARSAFMSSTARSTHCSRSEERRVGKECRSRRSAYHYKKNEARDSRFHMAVVRLGSLQLTSYMRE